MKRAGLTPAGAEKLRQSAIRCQPWRFSTGPRTPEGKAKVARLLIARSRLSPQARQLRQDLEDVKKQAAALAACRRELSCR